MVQGNVVTSYGQGVDTDKPYDDQGKTNYIAQGDFGLTYQAITSRTAAGSASTYTVRDGDTLGSIAQNAWGDSSLWWKIAIANGLAATDPSDSLTPGQTINLPGQVGGLHNNADTFKPYDPGEVVGDTTPNMPAPPPNDKGGGCGLIGKIIMVVVAVVATAYRGGPSPFNCSEKSLAPLADASAASLPGTKMNPCDEGCVMFRPLLVSEKKPPHAVAFAFPAGMPAGRPGHYLVPKIRSPASPSPGRM